MEVDGTHISIRLFWSNVYVSEDVLFMISLAAYSAMVRVKELVERGVVGVCDGVVPRRVSDAEGGGEK